MAWLRHLLGREHFVAILRQHPEFLQEAARQADRHRLSRPLHLGIELEPNAWRDPVDLARAIWVSQDSATSASLRLLDFFMGTRASPRLRNSCPPPNPWATIRACDTLRGPARGVTRSSAGSRWTTTE